MFGGIPVVYLWMLDAQWLSLVACGHTPRKIGGVVGASLSEPHTSELVLKNLLRYMYIFRDVRSGTVLIRIYLIACSKISINQLAS